MTNKIVIEAPVLQEILNYLAKQPFIEVAPLINAVQEKSVPYNGEGGSEVKPTLAPLDEDE